MTGRTDFSRKFSVQGLKTSHYLIAFGYSHGTKNVQQCNEIKAESNLTNLAQYKKYNDINTLHNRGKTPEHSGSGAFHYNRNLHLVWTTIYDVDE